MEGRATAELARRAVKAHMRGDVTTLRDVYAADVVWHVGGAPPLAGDYRGREALLSYFAMTRATTGGTLHLEPEAVLATDRHCGVFVRVTAERSGRRLDVLMAQVFRVNADGMLAEYWALADDARAVDEFWA